MGEAPQHLRRNIRLRDLLALVAVLSILGSIVVAQLAKARLVEQKKVKCASHLRRLGVCLVMWSSKFTNCCGTYPSQNPGGIALGRDVLQGLRTYPTRESSLCPDEDDQFVCPLRGTPSSPSALDYRIPSPAFPGGGVAAWAVPEWPVVCDRPTNHSPGGDDDINVLLYSGAVIRATNGSPEWNTAMAYTQDP